MTATAHTKGPAMRRLLLACAFTLACATLLAHPARADEPFTFMTDWYAQAEQGGFYQALAEGTYKRHGLDVTIRMGGPQMNVIQLMAAGQADCVIGSNDIQVMQVRAGGVPLKSVAAFFQKDPTVLIGHEDVHALTDLAGKTILISSASFRTFWPWLKAKYGVQDSQTRPYTFNIQPFVADPQAVQQGYLTADPFAIAKAGVKANVMLLGDFGYPSYANLVACMDATLDRRRTQVEAFVQASAEGWRSYLANPAPGNALIKSDNPRMTDEQLAYSVSKLRELGMVTGGDAATLGIGVMTDARVRATHDFLVGNGLLDAAKLAPNAAYDPAFATAAHIMP